VGFYFLKNQGIKRNRLNYTFSFNNMVLSDFFGGEIRHFALKKNSHATWLMELFGKFPENWPHFEELFFEIAKISGGFGQISSFFFFSFFF
jgi:hypothetical protein